MAVTRILQPQWQQTIATAIGQRDLTADTTFGPVYDIVAYPVSVVADSLNSSIVSLSDLLSLQNVAQFTSSDMAAIAYNYQIVPGPGSPSTVVVSLLSSSPPTSDVTIPINFPFSTDPDPQTNAVTFFASTQQVMYTAANAANFYDATHRMYRLDVPCACTTTGVATNVGPNSIVNAQRAIGGFQTITNFIGATSGMDPESNQAIANTILIFNLGIGDISTPYGIGLATTQYFPQISDYIVVYGSDPLLIRASVDAGATDLYVVGATSVTAQDTFTYDGQPWVLLNQPSISVNSVTDGSVTLIQGTDYALVPDLTGPYDGSVQSQDQIQFLPTAVNIPSIGDTIIVNYNYNALIGTLQNFFTSPTHEALGRSLLYKQAQQLLVAISGTLTPLPGFNPTVVQANVATAIVAYVNSLSLGEALEQFNLITYIGQNVGAAGGVDNFVLSLFNVAGQTGVLPQITPTEAQYIQTNANLVNVFLS